MDTDVLIDVQHGHPPALSWFAGLAEIPSIPGLVVMELIQGAKNARQVRDVQHLIAAFPVVWPSTVDCHRAMTDFSSLHLSHGLGLLDSLIAACALGLSAELCTFNTKHYRSVPGLRTIQPYTRAAGTTP